MKLDKRQEQRLLANQERANRKNNAQIVSIVKPILDMVKVRK